MTSKSYYNCLVCQEKIETSIEKIEDTSELLAEKLQSLFWIFCGHMKIDTDEDFDFLTESFPFCEICTLDLIELSRSHRKKNSLLKEKSISKIIAKLSFKILTICDDNSNQQGHRSTDLDFLTTTRSKILRIRQSIINAFSLKVLVERIDPVADKDRLLSQYSKDTQTVPSQNRAQNLPQNFNQDPVNSESDDDLSNESTDEDAVASQLFPVVIDLEEESGTEKDKADSTSEDKSRNVKLTKIKSKNQAKIKSQYKEDWTAIVEVSPGVFLFRNSFQFEKVDNGFVCSTCKFSSIHKQSVANHVRLIHYNKNKYSCSYCSKLFNRNSDCLRHEDIHKKRGAILEKFCRSEIFVDPGSKDRTIRTFLYKKLFPFEKSGDSYRCLTCQTVFTNRHNCTSHIRNLHLNVRKHACQYCEKTFPRKYELDRHEVSHTGAKNYLCQSCGDAFETPEKLRSHELTHQGIDPRKHVCQICSKRFHTKQELDNHVISRHTHEKAHECPVCFKKFGLKNSMLKHQRSHLETLPFLCHLCGGEFRTNGDVLRHVQKIHDQNKKAKPRKRIRVERHDMSTEVLQTPPCEAVCQLPSHFHKGLSEGPPHKFSDSM